MESQGKLEKSQGKEREKSGNSDPNFSRHPGMCMIYWMIFRYVDYWKERLKNVKDLAEIMVQVNTNTGENDKGEMLITVTPYFLISTTLTGIQKCVCELYKCCP